MNLEKCKVVEKLSITTESWWLIKLELIRRGLIELQWDNKDIKTLDDNHLINIYRFIEKKFKQSIERNYEREKFYDALESYYSNRDY